MPQVKQAHLNGLRATIARLRPWAAKGAGVRMAEIADERQQIYRTFPDLRPARTARRAHGRRA